MGVLPGLVDVLCEEDVCDRDMRPAVNQRDSVQGEWAGLVISLVRSHQQRASPERCSGHRTEERTAEVEETGEPRISSVLSACAAGLGIETAEKTTDISSPWKPSEWQRKNAETTSERQRKTAETTSERQRTNADTTQSAEEGRAVAHR